MNIVVAMERPYAWVVGHYRDHVRDTFLDPDHVPEDGLGRGGTFGSRVKFHYPRLEPEDVEIEPGGRKACKKLEVMAVEVPERRRVLLV